MRSGTSLARLATAALAEASHAPPAPNAEDEARTVDAIARAIEETARARRRRRVVFGVCAAACVAGLAGAGLLRHPRAGAHVVTATAHGLTGPTVLVRGESTAPLEGGVDVVAGDRIVAPTDARASLVLSTGTHLAIESGSDLRVAEIGAAERFDLRAGSVRADVAKLGPGLRFLIQTSDAEVEVRGTSFRVSIVTPSTCGGGSSTRVAVTEGVVVVRAGGTESRVAAGQEWPEGCIATAATSPAPPAPAISGLSVVATAPSTPTPSAPTPSAPAPSGPAPSAPASSAPIVEPAARASDIAEQNRLFAEASSAQRRGASSEATTRYEAFLARYPTSQLAESAMVQRMRLLGASRPSDGAAAAREYLRRYPGGFARQEATALAAAGR